MAIAIINVVTNIEASDRNIIHASFNITCDNYEELALARQRIENIPFPNGEMVEIELTDFLKTGQTIYESGISGDIDIGIVLEDAYINEEGKHMAKVRLDKSSDTYKWLQKDKRKAKEDKQKAEEEKINVYKPASTLDVDL